MEKGQSIHPNRDSQENLKKLEEEIGRDNFLAQYLQNPIENFISILSLKDISFYEILPNHYDYIIQSWDTAIKTTEESDYSVCSVWYIVTDKYYLGEVFKEKLSYPELKKKVINLAIKYSPKHICIEDKASGQSIIQDLRNEGYINIIAIKPKFDKITRFASIIPYFQSSRILFPKQATYLNMILDELIKFPSTKHDDVVDSISQAINYLINQKKTLISRIRDL
jgi:predicted phage terminase large subunit-like protein